MNANELAKLMIQWGETRKDLDALEDAIKQAVLLLGKTQTVGSVRASYRRMSVTPDYERAAEDGIFNGTTEDYHAAVYRNKKEVINWRAVCKELSIDTGHFVKKTTPPSVTIKLLDT